MEGAAHIPGATPQRQLDFMQGIALDITPCLEALSTDYLGRRV
ncbi:hypothetical protein PC112_g21039 [Phytophthora cactorum]|nr:hypothetical protein PC112_g21039 [Phytophthora cactorum]